MLPIYVVMAHIGWLRDSQAKWNFCQFFLWMKSLVKVKGNSHRSMASRALWTSSSSTTASSSVINSGSFTESLGLLHSLAFGYQLYQSWAIIKFTRTLDVKLWSVFVNTLVCVWNMWKCANTLQKKTTWPQKLAIVVGWWCFGWRWRQWDGHNPTIWLYDFWWYCHWRISCYCLDNDAWIYRNEHSSYLLNSFLKNQIIAPNKISQF